MAFRISSPRRLKAEKGKRIDGLIRPFLSLARWSAVYPSLRAIRLRWGRSRDFLFVRFVFVSIRGDCVVAHRHPRPRIAAAVIYRFATRLEARDNKARRLRGCRGPSRARCRLPRRTCVCVCVHQGDGCLVLEGQNTSVGFSPCGMLPSYLEYWIRGERTVPRSRNSFPTRTSQRFAAILDF